VPGNLGLCLLPAIVQIFWRKYVGPSVIAKQLARQEIAHELAFA
jgi:hypothetical protein